MAGLFGLSPTMRYAGAELDLKGQALAQVFPNAHGARKMVPFRCTTRN